MRQIVPYQTPHFIIEGEGNIEPLLGLLVTDDAIEGSDEKYHTYPVLACGLILDADTDDINGGYGDLVTTYIRRGGSLYDKCLKYYIEVDGVVSDDVGFENYCKTIGIPIANF